MVLVNSSSLVVMLLNSRVALLATVIIHCKYVHAECTHTFCCPNCGLSIDAMENFTSACAALFGDMHGVSGDCLITIVFEQLMLLFDVCRCDFGATFAFTDAFVELASFARIVCARSPLFDELLVERDSPSEL
jgi:hypothetical protein